MGAAALAGWQIVGNTIADTRVDPAEALLWRPQSEGALVKLAEAYLIAADDAAELLDARTFAERALTATPLSQRSLRVLGLVADIDDDPSAERLMTVAGNRAPREALTQLWLLPRYLDAGQAADAVESIDRILRSRPDLGDMLLPALAMLAAADEPVLAERLRAAPPWRGWFLARLPTLVPADVSYALLNALVGEETQPTSVELRPFLDQLIATQQFELAYLAWMHFLPAAASGGMPFLYNGSFTEPLSGLPFDWTVGGIRGAETTVATDGDDRALRVTFANTRVPYRHLAKMVVLPPGEYQFVGRARAVDIETERGMSWRIRCAEGEGVSLGETTMLRGSTSWSSFDVTFKIPATGCRAQWLRLELAARVALEEQISGEVWYDDLAIRRLVAGES